MTDDATTVMRRLEFTDSAFPVGTFSFSNGLETAAEEGLVHDAATLEQYTQDIVRQAAFTDGVAALHAFRSYNLGYYEGPSGRSLQDERRGAADDPAHGQETGRAGETCLSR